MKKVVLCIGIMVTVLFAWNGGGTTQPNSGNYWAFTPGDQPSEAPMPVTFAPVLDPMDADRYDVYTYRDSLGSIKLDPTTGTPIAFSIPDSFWFYGRWYLPGANLYISPDGFAGFDVDKAYPTGNLEDPTLPNAVMAPYWTDLSADGTGDEKRIWLAWIPSDITSEGTLIIQWYNVEDASGHTFDFSLAMVLGNRWLLYDEGCGVIFSRHYIDFSYREGDWGAEDPDATVGIENHKITPADHYYVKVPHSTGGEDIIGKDTVIRFYYRKIIKYDLMAYDVIAPDGIVLRQTRYEPIVTVANMGTEVVSSYNVTVTITEIGGDVVYQQSFSRSQLYYYHNPSGEDYIDTIECEPLWDKPGEIGTEYEIKVEITGYSEDQCANNNVYAETCRVWCDADYTLQWSFLRYPFYSYYWSPSPYKITGTAYWLPDGAALVMGGSVLITWSYGHGKDWHLEVWHHGDPTGCGWDQVTEREYSIYGDGKSDSSQTFPNETGVYFKYGEFKWQDVNGEWRSGYKALGEFGVMARVEDPCDDNTAFIYVKYLYSQDNQNISCLSLDDYSRYKPSITSPWLTFDGIMETYPYSTFVMGMKTHLALRYPPVPPAYYEKAHDLTVYNVTSPEYNKVNNTCYVVAGEAVTPKAWIGNIGRQKEESTTGSPIEAFFRAVPDDEEWFETYETSAVIDELGWIGDPGDDPDAVEMAFSDWTPEGRCDYGDARLEYDMQYIVKLNKVGPDRTDHCPYNDTLRITAISLWKHDAWMKEIHVYKNEMGGEEVENGEGVPANTKLYFKCVVANTGSTEEPHDIGGSKARFVARLEIVRDNDLAVVFGPCIEPITYLNWRGNPGGEPWETEVEFPDYWIVPDDKSYKIEFKVELDGDKCTKNNAKYLWFSSGVASTDMPKEFALFDITSPAKEAEVRYAVPVNALVNIKVYDVSGRLVRTLVSGEEEAGYKRVVWDGTDNMGRKAGAGVYYVEMMAGDYKAVKKVVMMR